MITRMGNISSRSLFIELALLILLSLALVGCDNAQVLNQSSVRPDIAVTATSIAELPTPVGTYYPPLSTEPPYTPPPIPTLQPPPAAIPMPITTGPAPNVAWSAETDNSLTIWAGRYSDSDGPTPSITGARAVAKWTGIRLELRSMAVSPDHKSLALLTDEPCIVPTPAPTDTPVPFVTPPVPFPNIGEECEGGVPQHIYVVEVATGKVQSIPDYGHYKLYEDSRNHYYTKILGWFDNQRFGIVQENGQMITATKDGASFIERRWPGTSIGDYIWGTTLLPGHNTIFSWVGDGFFFRDAGTGAVQRVGNRIEGTELNNLEPSPDGKHISSLESESDHNGNDFEHFGLWVQDLASDARKQLIGTGVWDTQPAWAPDSTRIAFAYADVIPPGSAIDSIDVAEAADTNVYIADVTAGRARQLTHFTGAHNSNIQWTAGGNLILSSTAGSRTGGPGIVGVSTVDGRATVLVGAEAGQRLVRPLFFGPVGVPGMPGTGAQP